MRILAIRGKNLASLADVFEVDFEAEPIRSSGIFAITGPNGAGKSTLLDAICLALFDSLPRMDRADKSAAIGQVDGESSVRVKDGDVRGILRHGAGAAYAEVDFSGQDGRRYRSRWEVNRARGRANGNLQHQRITLSDLTSGGPIGDKKTDTLQQIEKRIGLSFDQFRRSVLLAQGDFDTFIRAGSRDRAELLERITGTEIYSRISKAAFARDKEEQEALRDLETQLGEHQPLGDEARAAAEARVEEAKIEVDRIEAEKGAIDKALEWYNTKARFDARIAEGEAALEQASQIDQAAEADRVSLTVVKKAFSLRAELEAVAAIGRRLAAAKKALVGAVEAGREAIEKRDQAILASNAAKTERDEKRAAYDAIGPELDKAQRLDAMIETAKTDLATQKSLLEERLSARDEARAVVTAVDDALKSARDQRENDARWLAEHQSVEALSVRMEDVAKDLSERLTLKDLMASTSEKVEQLEREIKADETSRLQKETAIAALQQQERELDDQIAAFRQIADEIDVLAVEVKRDGLTAIHAALDDARDAAKDAGKASAEIVTADEEEAHQNRLIREACDVIAQVGAELPTDMARLEEARRSLELSEAAGSELAQRLRLTLEDGQPCPVCGATEHPVTDVNRLLKDRVSADRRHVAELEARVSASREGVIHAKTQTALAQEALQGVTRRKSVHKGELQTARERWRGLVAAVFNSCSGLGVAVPTFAEDAASADATQSIGPFREVLDSILGQAKDTLKCASDAEAAARKLSSERETVRANLTTVSDEFRKLTTQEHVRAQEVVTLGTKLQGMEQNFAAVCSRLDMVLTPVFPGWRAEVSNLGAALAEDCLGLVDVWRECRKRSEAVGTEISRLEADLAGKQATLKAADAVLAEAEKHYRDKTGALDNLAAERLDVIGGRPVGDVRTEYQQRSEATEHAWHEAEAMRATAEQDVAARSSDTLNARHACDGAGTDHELAERALAEKLEACEITREQAEVAITMEEAWVAVEQARLDRLREAVATARATLAAGQQSVKDHEAAGRPEQTRDEINAGLADMEERRAKISKEFMAASSVLYRDDQSRARIAEIKTRLDTRREKARVWGQLNELIGSADGAKFRRFAQSLTLDHLIHQANWHLANLHPRYELQRAPDSDLALQVTDHDMADEVRGVHNLSGGERFLVSLALALGLASMSSSRGIKIDSLFIDEGFGALDSTNLAMAVSVLEQLQATGRRVGVISHVDELKERIAVKVEVFPIGSGRSIVQVITS